jgi:hypothetical protein
MSPLVQSGGRMVGHCYKGMQHMATTAIRIAFVAYDAARRHFDAAVEFFAPGLPVPLRVGVTMPAAQSIGHQELVKGLVNAAQRQILR